MSATPKQPIPTDSRGAHSLHRRVGRVVEQLKSMKLKRLEGESQSDWNMRQAAAACS
jgi:hypothetical protein